MSQLHCRLSHLAHWVDNSRPIGGRLVAKSGLSRRFLTKEDAPFHLDPDLVLFHEGSVALAGLQKERTLLARNQPLPPFFSQLQRH